MGRVSEFVDSHIKSLVPGIPSYIKDTKHFLQVLRDLGRLSEGALIIITGPYKANFIGSSEGATYHVLLILC